MKKRIVCGLDIGTSKICLACGTVNRDGTANILGSCTVPTQNINAAKPIDSAELSAGIKEVRNRLRRSSEVKVKRVYVNIDSLDLKAQWYRQNLSFEQPTRINRAQISRLINSCLCSNIPLGQEVIHTGFRSFTVDNQPGCLNPEGLSARELEMNLVMVSAPAAGIKNMTRRLSGAGLTLEGMVYSAVAQALGLIADFTAQTKKNYLLVDVGAGLTKLTSFQHQLVKDMMILPEGAHRITEDIAAKLKLPLDCAEQLKLQYGRCLWEERHLRQTLAVKDGATQRIILPEALYDIVAYRADQLLQQIKEAVLKMSVPSEESCEIIFTGGGAILEGFLEKAEQILATPVRMGSLARIDDRRIQAQSAFYSTSIGLIYVGFADMIKIDKRVVATRTRSLPFTRLAKRAQLLYREYF